MFNALLRDAAADGYPSDYLLARVHARRATLAAQWIALRERGLPAATSDEAIWSAFLHELGWLRAQMDRRLRAEFAPVFGAFELKTLVLCLRNKAAMRDTEIERLLASSQLADELRRALSGGGDVPAALAVIATALRNGSSDPDSIQAAYAEAGLKGVETYLTRRFHEQVAASRLHPAIRSFLATFADLRNLMTLYKHLRWEVVDAAAFFPGGTIELSQLNAVEQARDLAALDRLVRRMAGRDAPPVATAEASLETILLGSLSRVARGLARESPLVGTLLDYAWRAYVHARNQSLLLHAGDVDPAKLARELVA